MSKQNDILEALRARLRQIRIADGYATDIGATVFRGRRAISPDHPPAARSSSTRTRSRKQSPGTGAIHTAPVAFEALPVSIEAHAACDPDHPNVTAHAMVADIKRAIFGGDLTWGRSPPTPSMWAETSAIATPAPTLPSPRCSSRSAASRIWQTRSAHVPVSLNPERLTLQITAHEGMPAGYRGRHQQIRSGAPRMSIQNVTNEYAIPRGRTYLDKLVSGVGEGEVVVGNVPGFAISIESTKADHYSSESGLRQKDKTITIEVNRTAQITIDNFTPENLAYFPSGEVETITQAAGAATTETITVKQGRTYQLGKTASLPAGSRDISAVTVEPAGGGTAFVEGTDYNLDLALARLQIIVGGALPTTHRPT